MGKIIFYKLLNSLLKFGLLILLSLLGGWLYSQDCSAVKLRNQVEVDSFTSVYPDCGAVEVLEIIGPDIYRLDSLYTVTSVDRLLIDSTSVESLHGLQFLQNCRLLEISDNPNLGEITNLGSLDIGHGLWIANNQSLKRVDNVTVDSMRLIVITSNENLESIDGLVVESIEMLELVNNPSLSIETLKIQNIESFISQENGISSYSGLSGLNIRSFHIALDSTITDITDLENIQGLRYLTLQRCVRLEACSSEFICEAINDPAVFSIIHSNASGCANINEVREGCISSLDDMTDQQYLVTVFPNPVGDELNIRLGNGYWIGSYIIYNVSGQMVKEGILFDSNMINVAELNSGIYLLRFTDRNTNQSSVTKFIKL